jgi:putative membrane protein
VHVRPVEAVYGAAVLAEVGYPLVSGAARDVLTVVTVVLVAAGALLHAFVSRGRRAFAVLAAVTVVGGFAVEVIGVHTGVPFGRYHYTGGLGATLFGVPVVIALAWTMLAWPAALAARRLCRGPVGRVLLGGWALAAWDVFLDPQMVAADHWHWADPHPHLPAVPSVPLGNYAGWLAVSLLVSLALQWVLRDLPDADDRTPLAFYVWTWASSALALAAFLDLAGAAVWGALAMGVVAVPVVRTVLR